MKLKRKKQHVAVRDWNDRSDFNTRPICGQTRIGNRYLVASYGGDSEYSLSDPGVHFYTSIIHVNICKKCFDIIQANRPRPWA